MPLKNKLLTSSLLAGAMLLGASVTYGELLFSESFDDQPDWDKMSDPSPSSPNSRDSSKGDVVPLGWDLVRSEATWAPSSGHMDRHESFEIKAADSAKARGGKGKAMVNWRDSHDPGWKRWNSDGILLKKIGNQNQVYVEFYVAFSPETYATFNNNPAGVGTSKIFRIYGFTGDWSDPFDYFAGATHPEVVWAIDGEPFKYGLRNKLSLYGMHNDDGNYPDMPSRQHGGDFSLSYISSLEGMASSGGNAKLIDKKNGGYMLPGGGVATMERMFGPPGSYTKVAFFVKLNSAKGVNDGVLIQWIDDTQILYQDTINWVPSDKNGIAWNVIGFGGNDFFQSYPNAERHEEWYAIDDIKVLTDIPDDLRGKSENAAAPNPPLGIEIN